LDGERKAEEVKDDAIFFRRERGAGRFARVFKLPFDIKDEKVSAKFNNGILTISLSKAESSKPKKIEIMNI
jgi:HSP20 family protein